MHHTPNTAYSHEISESDMLLTPAARSKLVELMADAEHEITGIRIFVVGEGCGGMTYGITFIEETTKYDSILDDPDFKLAIDPIALNYLRGCQIDFTESTFVFKNVFQSIGGSGVCDGCGGSGF